MTTLTQPEPWLRGPVDGFEPLLMPVVHAFIQAREDVGHLVARRASRAHLGTSRRSGFDRVPRAAPRRRSRSALHLCPWRGLVGHAEGGDACRK